VLESRDPCPPPPTATVKHSQSDKMSECERTPHAGLLNSSLTPIQTTETAFPLAAGARSGLKLHTHQLQGKRWCTRLATRTFSGHPAAWPLHSRSRGCQRSCSSSCRQDRAEHVLRSACASLGRRPQRARQTPCSFHFRQSTTRWCAKPSLRPRQRWRTATSSSRCAVHGRVAQLRAPKRALCAATQRSTRAALHRPPTLQQASSRTRLTRLAAGGVPRRGPGGGAGRL
jgi:hypothetical protein